MELTQIVARILMFLLLSSVLLGLLDRTFRLRFSLSIYSLAVVSRARLGTSLGRVCRAWEDNLFGNMRSLVRAVWGTLWICLTVLAFPLIFIFRCLVTACVCIVMFVWTTVWRMAFGFASLLLLAGLLIFALSGTGNRMVNGAIDSSLELATVAARTSIYHCAVVDPQAIYPLMGGDQQAEKNAMLDILGDLNQEGSRYDTAIAYFEQLAAASDADDDLHFISLNNVGCLELAQGAGPTSSADNAAQQSASHLMVMSAAPIENAPPHAAMTQCASAQKSIADGNKQLSITTIGNMMVGWVATRFDCRPKPAVIVERSWVPSLALEIQWPRNEMARMKSVMAELGAEYQVSFGGEEPAVDARRVSVSGDAIYCYQLRSTLLPDDALLTGEGAIFVDADKPSPTQGVRSFYITSGSGQVRLADSLDSFVMEFDATDLLATVSTTVTLEIMLDDIPVSVYQNGVQTTSIILTPNDRHELVTIDMPADRRISSLQIAVDGGLLEGSWEVTDVSDEDVFSVRLLPDAIALKRMYCGGEADLMDMAGAVAALKGWIDARDLALAKQTADIALRLGDPDSAAISPETWAALCKWGSFAGSAGRMLDTACTIAIEDAKLAVTRAGTEANKGLAKAYDSRGIAYVLYGNDGAAVADFKHALELDSGLPNAKLRRQWIEALNSKGASIAQGGIFDERTIADLMAE
jgi:hypothetical protein